MGKAEAAVEKELDKHVKFAGGFSRKWVSPGHAGVEDRICFFPDGEVWFIEVKTAGRKPDAHQLREIMRQRELGHNAGYLAGIHEVISFISSNRVEWMDRQMNGLTSG